MAMGTYDADEYGKIFKPIFLFIIGLFIMGVIFLLSSSVITDNMAHKFAIGTGITLTVCGMLGIAMSCIATCSKLGP